MPALRPEGEQRFARLERRRHRAAAAPSARNATPACPAPAAPSVGDRQAIASARPSTRSIASRGSAAGPQQRRLADAGDDGRLDADRARAAIDDQIDAAAQVGEHVRGAGRRDVAGAIGRWRHHRPAEGARAMRAPPDAPARAPRRCRARPVARSATRAIRLLWQHQRQRPRPERRRQPFGGGVEDARARARGVDVGDMGDQRIEGRPALGRIEPGDGLAVAGVGAEPVDGLGRKRDQPAGGKAARRGLDRLVDRPSKSRVPGSAVIASLKLAL